MKLTSQKWLILLGLFLAFIIAIGVMASIRPDTSHSGETKTLLLSTSTPKPETSGTGWWNAIPTDPSLPAMPKDGSPTATPSQTSIP